MAALLFRVALLAAGLAPSRSASAEPSSTVPWRAGR